MLMRPLVSAAISLAFIASQPAGAQSMFTRPADAIKYRQGLFQVMGLHSQRIGSMLKNEHPFDKATAENDAAIIDMMARQLDAAFPPGSDTALSKGRPEIWQDPVQFKNKLDNFKLTTPRLLAAAKSGDIQSLRAAFSASSQSCKSCHEDFRNR
jgi:cytochrome c556